MHVNSQDLLSQVVNQDLAHPPTARRAADAPAQTRRRFLQTTSLLTLGLSVAPASVATRGADAPSNKVVLAVIGASRSSNGGDGRGSELAVGFASIPGVEIAAICDVDERNPPKAIESIMSKAKPAQPPKGVRDFRRLLEDKSIDALVVATPDHWHAPIGILGCLTGKHVYVEKPCSHNPHEGELLVMAARKYRRVVQHGTQRRSWSGLVEGVNKVRNGEIGRVLFAQSWYYGPRPSIGKGNIVPVPAWLDYNLWQGPAPERPYRDNLIHYNWHWFWHWGTGELGNNGVHMIDLCRWGMGVDYPNRVTSSGGKYRYPDDDQETPDTNVVSFDFPSGTITWEQRSWAAKTSQDPAFEVAFHGEKGILTIRDAGYTLGDEKGKELSKGSGTSGNAAHLQNFVDAIRGTQPLNAEIEEGFKSTLLCHLGNIAYRTGRTIHFDGETRKLVGDKAAEKLWIREYRREWQPKI